MPVPVAYVMQQVLHFAALAGFSSFITTAAGSQVSFGSTPSRLVA